MSIGPASGMAGSAAGSQLAQTCGSDLERTQQDTSNQTRQVKTEKTAEDAAGIGQTEEDQQSSDRDADGRRVLERSSGKKTDDPDDTPKKEPPQSEDPTGQCGTQLDLTG